MSEPLRTYNDQASVDCLGYAIDPEGNILVMLDVVGHKAACKSVWATVVGGLRKTFHVTPNVPLCGGNAKHDKYAAFWTELSEQNVHNLLICHTRVLDAATTATTDPKDLHSFYLTTAERIDTSAQSRAEVAWPDDPASSGAPTFPPRMILQRFAAMLNQALEIPVLAHWARPLWDMGLEAELITPVTCGGDISEAYRVLPDGELWAAIVADAFVTHALHILTGI